MTTPAHRAILFDADGVLVDSHGGYRDVWARWSRLRGLDPAVVLAATHARRPLDTIADVAPGLDAVAEYAVLVDLVNELPGVFSVFPDVADLLGRLPTDRWAIVTSGDAHRVRAHLRAGGVPAPLVLVDGSAVRHGKPDPEGYLLAAERLAARVEDCVVVEDAPAGVEAGLAAGMRVVAVTTSHPAQELTRAEMVVPSLAAARSALLSWVAGGDLAPMP